MPCDVCQFWARPAADELAAHHPDCPKAPPTPRPNALERLIVLGRPVVYLPESVVPVLDPVQWDAKYCPQAPPRFARLRRWLRRLLRRLGLLR